MHRALPTIFALITLCISVLSSAALIMASIGYPISIGQGFAGPLAPVHPSEGQVVLQGFPNFSYVIAPTSWVILCGLWIWRGKVRSKWNSSGFTQEAFDLLVRMKGGPTRMKLLQALSVPKDRSQLASELQLDWKAVDRHVQLLQWYNFIREDSSYGQIVLSTITPEGDKLLRLTRELDSEFRN
jgi:hypothetical protein